MTARKPEPSPSTPVSGVPVSFGRSLTAAASAAPPRTRLIRNIERQPRLNRSASIRKPARIGPPTAHSPLPNGANALLVVDAMIALLKEAGLDDPTISWAVDLLYLFITACAAEQSVYVDKESEGQTEAGVVKALEDYYATVSAERYPMVFALRRQLMVGTGDERGSWALKVLINGILGTPAEIV